MEKKNNIVIKRIIQRCGCDMVLPLTLVYVFYLILHGHLSPGGGFQGGVLVVAVIILIYLGHGYETTCRAISPRLMHDSEGFASILYIALAMLGVVCGVNFCQNVLYYQGNIGELFSSGTVLWMNLTVGMKVFTGIAALSLTMLGLLSAKDVDNRK